MKKTIAKSKKLKPGSLRRKQTDKPLARLNHKNREKIQVNRIRNEKGEITTDTAETQRIMKDY